MISVCATSWLLRASATQAATRVASHCLKASIFPELSSETCRRIGVVDAERFLCLKGFGLEAAFPKMPIYSRILRFKFKVAGRPNQGNTGTHKRT